MRAIFLSDLHLRGAQDQRLPILLAQLDREIASASLTHLFLLGDIFDLWIGAHQHFIQEYAPLMNRLARLRQEGVEIHYFEGNHDLHLAAYWRDQLGAKVHVEPVLMNLTGLRLRLEHGDQMNPDDLGYLRLRAFLRTSFMAWVASSLPGQVTELIGQSMSRASRRWTGSAVMFRDESQIRSMILDHAHRASNEHEFDVLIAGHVHVRLDETISSRRTGQSIRVINLGCWPGADRRSRIQDVKVLELSGHGHNMESETQPQSAWRWIDWSISAS